MDWREGFEESGYLSEGVTDVLAQHFASDNIELSPS